MNVTGVKQYDDCMGSTLTIEYDGGSYDEFWGRWCSERPPYEVGDMIGQSVEVETEYNLNHDYTWIIVHLNDGSILEWVFDGKVTLNGVEQC